jgi:MerR family mercuric resistance operon transcriptional regulator
MAGTKNIGTFSIGDLSRRTGIPVETIRYYERIGLEPAPGRTAGGHRAYDDKALKRLGFVKRSRALGFSLQDIRALLSLAENGKRKCGDVRTVTETHLAALRRKRIELQRLERQLVTVLERCVDPDASDCAIIDVLLSADGQAA